MRIDHVGLGVPDVEVAKAYYDGFMPLVGFVRAWEVGYRPIDWQGAQIFLYPALEDGGNQRPQLDCNTFRSRFQRVVTYTGFTSGRGLAATRYSTSPSSFPSTTSASTRH